MQGECFHTCGETKGTRLLVMGPTVSWLVGGRGQMGSGWSQMGSEAFGGLLPPPPPPPGGPTGQPTPPVLPQKTPTLAPSTKYSKLRATEVVDRKY